MTFDIDAPNKKLTITFDDEEWSTFKFMRKTHGNPFLKDFLERFFRQRKEQRKELRKEKMIATFNSLTPAQQQQVLSTMNLDFDDE